MEEFPSGQRGQTVNLLLLASVVRIHPPPPEKRTLRFAKSIFSEINPFGICEIALRAVKYLRCVKRAAARRDLFHNNCKLFFTILRKQKISQCASIISHFASAKYFTKTSLKSAKHLRIQKHVYATASKPQLYCLFCAITPTNACGT